MFLIVPKLITFVRGEAREMTGYLTRKKNIFCSVTIMLETKYRNNHVGGSNRLACVLQQVPYKIFSLKVI